MRKSVVALTVIFALALVAGVVAAQQQSTPTPPPWAYGFATPPPPPAPAGAAPAAGGGGGGQRGGAGAPGAAGAGGQRGAGGGGGAAPDPTTFTVPGSTASFTLAQVRDGFGPADWFPGDHPTMPEIVAHGRREGNVNACSLCHYPNGKGRAENAGVSGLPYSYFVQTMMDFKNDNRKSADTRKANTTRMAAIAKAMTDDEIKAAATYFAAIKWTSPWIKVVEADMVPKTRIAGGLFIALEGADAGKEPIAGRIIEVPDNAEQTENMRNPRSGFTAYVPVGAIKKGEALVMTGANGKTTQCSVCHGPNLTGMGPVPGIAGRSPSYMVRQLFDMQQGIRKGEWSTLMNPVVSKLTADDMLNIAAYAASRTP